MQLKELLKNEGYMTIALPADDIEAQQILVRDNNGGLKRLPDKVYNYSKATKPLCHRLKRIQMLPISQVRL